MVPKLTRFRQPLLFLLLLLLLAVLPISAIAAETGTITAPANHVNEGSTLQLSTNMSGTVTWTSNRTGLATVSSTGLVTGIQAGQVTITASCSGYADATFTLWVTVPDGVYYIKNSSSGHCMQTTEETTYVYTQNTSQDGRINQLWKISYISNGNYVIRPLRDFSMAMTVSSSGYVAVADAPADDSSVSSSMYWKIVHNAFGYAFKYGGADSKTAMPTVNGSTGVPVYPSSWTANFTCHWALEPISGIFLRDTTTQKIVPSSTTKPIDLNRSYTLMDLGLSCDNYVSSSGIIWFSSDTTVATVNSSTGKVSGVSAGTAIITGRVILHGSPIDVQFLLQVYDDYLHQLTESCHFSFNDALLIHSVYTRVCSAYPNDSSMLLAWRTARVLGGIVYDGNTWGAIRWNDVAGTPFSGDKSAFFVDVLCFTQAEYNQICAAIYSNHSSGNTDFAHMQISLAARLAYQLHKTGILSNIYTISSDENVSYLAGWLGDATITGSNGTTSFGNDDYHADLDAENVFRLIFSGRSYVSALNHYYSHLSAQTRAECFLSHISYAAIESKVYYELIDKNLYALIATAEELGDWAAFNLYSDLLFDEQYHIDTIKTQYPDTYDFLCSVRDGLSDISDY